MQEEGIVTEVMGELVRVKTERKSACGGNCKGCGGCSAKNGEVVAKNCIGAKEGDRVFLEIPSGRVLRAAFLVYIIPLLMLIFGYYAASMFTKNDGICALSGFGFMIVSFFVIHMYDKKIREKYRPCAVSFAKKQQN